MHKLRNITTGSVEYDRSIASTLVRNMEAGCFHTFDASLFCVLELFFVFKRTKGVETKRLPWICSIGLGETICVVVSVTRMVMLEARFV